MTPRCTQDRVRQLAPDPASLKAGQGLAAPRKWVALGFGGGFAWGECQGSGAKPYQVRFDLSDGGSKCSCPSRKFPCKHALGLMLILTSTPAEVPERPMPPWVEEWAASRAEREKKKQEKAEAPAKPVDEAAQSERFEKRLSRIESGAAALKTWSEDLIKTGIAGVPSKGYEFFDEPARRLIDAQAPGLARQVQDLARLAASGAGWQHRFVEQMASAYLLVRAFEKLDSLPEPTRDDVLAALGVPLRPEQVAALPGTRDVWQVLAREVETEDRLRVQRTWLFGTGTKLPALVLAFAHGNAPLDASLAPGTSFDGELAFHPGNGVRAVVKTRSEPEPLPAFRGLATLDELCDLAADRLARHPWLGELAVPLHGSVPVRSGEKWLLTDSAARAVPAILSDRAGWLAMAMSGGRPIDWAAAYDGRALRPLAVMVGGEYVSLTQ